MRHFFAQPSVGFDACPTAVLQAMSSGLVVAMSDKVGLHESFAPDRDFLLVPGAKDAWIAALQKDVALEPGNRHAIGAAAREAIIRSFSWAGICTQIEALIQYLTVKLLYIFPEEFTGRFAREYHVYRLAESLAAAGVDVTLAAAPSKKLYETRTAPRPLRRQPAASASRGLAQAQVLPRPAENPQRRVVFSPIGPAHLRPETRRRFTPCTRKRRTTRQTASVRSRSSSRPMKSSPTLIPEDSPRHRRLLEMERRIYAHVRGVVAISPYLAESLQTRFSLRVPLRVQHDGIDESMLLDSPTPPDPHELIYAGSLQPWKGVPVAIEAMRLLPEFHLTVLGGEGQSLDSSGKTRPPTSPSTGQVSRDAMRPFLQKASIGLMPNLLEPRSALYTFPLKLLEYSAAGKGIVASQIPVFDKIGPRRLGRARPQRIARALSPPPCGRCRNAASIAARPKPGRPILWKNQGVSDETISRNRAQITRRP